MTKYCIIITLTFFQSFFLKLGVISFSICLETKGPTHLLDHICFTLTIFCYLRTNLWHSLYIFILHVQDQDLILLGSPQEEDFDPLLTKSIEATLSQPMMPSSRCDVPQPVHSFLHSGRRDLMPPSRDLLHSSSSSSASSLGSFYQPYLPLLDTKPSNTSCASLNTSTSSAGNNSISPAVSANTSCITATHLNSICAPAAPLNTSCGPAAPVSSCIPAIPVPARRKSSLTSIAALSSSAVPNNTGMLLSITQVCY